jgi:hypothetical protein
VADQRLLAGHLLGRVDGYGRKKPLWYAMRDAYADRLLTLRPRTGAELLPGGPDPVAAGAVFTAEGAPALIAVNDGRTPWTVEATVTRRNLAGEVLAAATLSIPVAAGAAVTTPLPPEVTTPGDPSGELIVADAGEARTLWFFARDKDIAWPAAAFSASVETAGPSTKVTVTAETILRSLTLYPDRLDPRPRPTAPVSRCSRRVGDLHRPLRTVARPGGADHPPGPPLRQRHRAVARPTPRRGFSPGTEGGSSLQPALPCS